MRRRPPQCGGLRHGRSWQDTEKVHQQRSRLAQRLYVRDKVRFVSSLAVALLDGPFAFPA
jgi:hypothetical protein